LNIVVFLHLRTLSPWRQRPCAGNRIDLPAVSIPCYFSVHALVSRSRALTIR
jgi:hypothetical protein